MSSTEYTSGFDLRNIYLLFHLFMRNPFQLTESLAKLLHDFAASASLLFGQVACRGLRTDPRPILQAHAQDSSQSQANVNY